MHYDIGQGILIGLGLLVASVTVVGLILWGLYKAFSDNESPDEDENQSADQ